MSNFSKEFLNKTMETWQPYNLATLSSEDARAIAENMTNLFLFLIELEQKYDKKEKKL